MKLTIQAIALLIVFVLKIFFQAGYFIFGAGLQCVMYLDNALDEWIDGEGK